MQTLAWSGEPHGRTRTGWGLFLVFAGLWLWLSYDRGFNLPDEGNHIYPAIRVLHGEMPHRDFATLYTGGVCYWYALLFTLFGVHLGVIRVVTAMVVGLIAVLTVRIAARVTSGVWAFLPGVVVILSFPLNPTSYNSWYAVLGGLCSVLALLQYLDTGRLRFLLLAGLSAGGGFLAKQTMGLFTFSALIGFVLWQFPLLSNPDRPGWDRLLRGVSLSLMAIGYTRFLQPAWMKTSFVGEFFLAPLWLMALTVWVSGFQSSGRSRTSSDRAHPSTIRMLGAIGLGFLLPVGVYAGYFAWHGGLLALIDGVFRFPGRYLMEWVEGNSYPPQRPWILNAVGTFLALLLWPSWGVTQRWSRTPFLRVLWWLLCAGFLIYPIRLIRAGWAYHASLPAFLSWANDEIFFSVIFYLPVVLPWVVMILLLVESVRPGSFNLSVEQQRIISVVYVYHVYQFFCVYPMMHPFYLVYMLPTTFLMATFLAHRFWMSTCEQRWRSFGRMSRLRKPVALASLVSLPVITILAFLVWGTQYWIGLRQFVSNGRVVWDDRVPIRVKRGGWGFVLKQAEAAPIQAVCRYLQTHTAPTEPVFAAAATSPLILFLSERLTPSRMHFPLGLLDQADQEEMVSALERTRTRYVVVDWNQAIQAAAVLWQYIDARYTVEAEIGEYRVFRRRDIVNQAPDARPL